MLVYCLNMCYYKDVRLKNNTMQNSCEISNIVLFSKSLIKNSLFAYQFHQIIDLLDILYFITVCYKVKSIQDFL